MLNHNILIKIIVLGVLCMPIGCAETNHNNEKQAFHTESMSDITQNQAASKSASKMLIQHKRIELQANEMTNKDVIIRLCKGSTVESLQKTMLGFQVTIQKKLSPTLMTVIWHDERSVEAVVNQLNASGMFCGAEKNQEVHIMGR